MNVDTTYVAVRDDKSHRSLSLNERTFLREGAHAPTALRLDGRRGDEVRKVRLKLGRWDNGAECTIHWGAGTRVTAMCTSQLVPPMPDRPNEGMINFSVDLSPMAGTAFRQAPPVSTAPNTSSTVTARASNFSDKNQRLISNQILRSVERIILLGGALDSEALVLIPGSWVWRINIALTVMDDGGNILDACVLAAVAALRHYRKPHVDIQNSDGGRSVDLPTLIPSNLKEPTPLPLHHSPLSISFALIPANEVTTVSEVSTLVDPEKREELVQLGSLTIAMNQHMEVCLLDYGGGYELRVEKLRECLKTAASSVKHLCQELETALERADVVAQKEMLRLLQRRNNKDVSMETDGFTLDVPEVPYLQTNVGQGDTVDVGQSTAEVQAMDQARTEAEEAYRQQALDYSLGHVASAVREDEAPSSNEGPKSSSLFYKLLKAADNKDKEVETTSDTPASVGPPKIATENALLDMDVSKPQNLEPVVEEIPATKPLLEAAEKSSNVDTIDDDDEEETTMTLSSEFQTASKSSKSEGQNPAVDDPAPVAIDDLAMAVKKKKKGKKDKKKK